MLPVTVEPGAEQFDYGALDEPVAKKARAAAERIRERLKSAIIETGRDLIAIKVALDHGQFGKWLDAEFGWSDRTARNLMSAAELANTKSEIVSVLPAGALYKLAAPSTPEVAKNEIISRLTRGEQLTAEQVSAAVTDARRKADMARQTEIRVSRRLAGKGEKAKARILKDEARQQAVRQNEADDIARRDREAEEACAAALWLLEDRLGRDFEQFVALYETAGSGRFSRALTSARMAKAA